MGGRGWGGTSARGFCTNSAAAASRVPGAAVEGRFPFDFECDSGTCGCAGAAFARVEMAIVTAKG